MNFGVDHPQLETAPGVARAGLKRYPLHKNDTSYDFLLGTCVNVPPPVHHRSFAYETTIAKLKHELKAKQVQLERMQLLSQMRNTRKPAERRSEIPENFPRNLSKPELARSISMKYQRFIPTARNTNPYLEHARQFALFQAPRFTRSRPKRISPNPITGVQPQF